MDFLLFPRFICGIPRYLQIYSTTHQYSANGDTNKHMVMVLLYLTDQNLIVNVHVKQ